MKRNSRRPDLLEPRRALARLINDHLNRGQRADVEQRNWKPWTDADFSGYVGVSPNTVSNWRSEDYPMPPTDIVPLLNILFGDIPAFQGWRRDLRDAWSRAKGLLPPDSEQNTSEDISSEWEIRNTDQSPGLAELRLHPPRPGNKRDTFYLDATFRMDLAEYEWECRTIFIGVRDVGLAIDSPSYQPAKGTLVAERRPMENMKLKPGGLEFHPDAGKTHLEGDILRGEHIAVMEPTATAEAVITVTAHAGRRSFLLRAEDKLAAVSNEQDAILNVLIHKTKPKDALGRVVLARSRIEKKSAK
jgi:hypothetical protein